MRKLIRGLLAVALLSGCGDRAQVAAQAPPTPASEDTSAKSPVAEVGRDFAEGDAADPTQAISGMLPTDASWGGLLETLPEVDREHLQAMNARYFGALAFGNAAERKRLLELGFPTTQDILEASRLTDGELKARADGGDTQAQMLLVDRLLARAEEARARKPADPKAIETSAMKAMFEASMLISRTNSPFGAYLDGRTNWKLGPDMPAEVMAASLMVAADLGDWRAETWLRQFERENPGLDAAATLSAYKILRRTWRVSQEARTPGAN